MAKTKQDICERIDRLNREAMEAANRANKHERAKQSAERSSLAAECEALGGHCFVNPLGIPGATYQCAVCRTLKADLAKQAAHNLAVG